MRRLVVSVGVAAALGLTACGGGGSGDKTAAATTTAPPVSAPATSLRTGNDQANTAFCRLAKTYTDKYQALLPSVNDPTKLRAATTDAETAIREAQSTAPAEIKPDVTVVATTATQVLTSLQRNNFDINKTPPADIAKLQDPAFQSSFAKLNAYIVAHCGVS